MMLKPSVLMKFCTVVWLTLSSWMCVCCESVYEKIETPLLPEGVGSMPLKHMLLYRDILYVGATNRIFKVSFNLSVLVKKDIGPVEDNFMCDLPPGRKCEFSRNSRDNVNKVLLINEYQNEVSLVTCGSVYQGACETRNLQNLEIIKKYHGVDKSPPTVHAVAADTLEGSTVAYIAPGFSGTRVMYVATTYTGGKDRPFREMVPAISTRKVYPPDEMFNFYYVDPSPIKNDASKIFIQQSIRSQFIVEYIAGFTSETYSYFLTTQPQSENKLSGSTKRISKLIHICQDDKLLESYVDIPLECHDGQQEYNLITSGTVIQPGVFLQKNMRLLPHSEKVLVATFTDESGNNSAVCVYSMNNIRSKVSENAQLCRNGTTSVNGKKYIQYGSDCQKIDIKESADQLLCHKHVKKFARIAGIVGVRSNPAVVYNNVTLTSVALSTTTDFTVAFIGDSKGQIRKLVLDSATSGIEYDKHLAHDLQVTGGSAINKDMFLDSTLKYLFAMTEKTVARLRVEKCEQYTTCYDCLSSRDPYCGWCTLENRCTIQSNCPKPDVDRWSNGQTSNCIEIMNISPSFVSASEVIQIHLTITKLPRRTNYSCVFLLDSGEWPTQADIWSFGLNCRNSPNVTSLGMDFGPKGHRNITIAVKSLETGKLFVTKEITFYNCASFTSCSQCTDNSYSCDWCIYENRCTYDDRACDPEGVVVSRNDSDANSTRFAGAGKRGPLHCPHMNRLETEPLYIPDSIRKTIDIRGHNFPDLQEGKYDRYKAIISGRSWEVTALCNFISSSRLRCDVPKREYSLQTGMLKANIKVLFDNNIEIEHDGVEVSIYSCKILANEECSYCKYMENHKVELECRWCGGQCEYKTFCGSRPSNEVCPGPQVTTVNPINGHYMGGTQITIQGKNLGSQFSDIESQVTVAGVPCTPKPDFYIPSRRIVCETGASNEGDKSGPVTILGHRFTSINFHYLNPHLNRVFPNFGPKSGGSNITIKGLYLNCGNSITVTINNRTCAIVGKRTVQYVKCTTPGNPEPGEGLVTARVDGQKILSFLTFNYHEDPTITSIHPLKSFVSGGRSLTVTGTNFTCIQKPKMFTIVNSVRNPPSPCVITNSTRMTCPTPKLIVSNLNRLKRSTSQLVATIGFIMDNVASVRNLSANFPSVADTLEYFSDPIMFNFTETDQVKEFKGEVLIVRGKFLNVAADKDDIKVFVGKKPCNITNLQENQIYCTPPSVQPEVVDTHADRTAPAVVVKIGNRQYLIGYLRYEAIEMEESGSILMYVIIGVSALAFFIIVAGIFFCCFYQRQKTQSKREFKKMQIQLDSLESNVRNECRQAFAELQTDMTDLTNDLDASKKPFYSFESYTFNVLFPGMLDHVILHPPLKNGNSIDRHPDVGIMHFSQLLQNKHFLLLLIRTLERQKSFSIRDKSNVASLLMILYQNNMEYATEILKTLLNDLVEKSVESKHPKLMLRRTESVVEKLLANWLSLCLYKYLVDEAHFSDSAGSSLYILYKAIKVQVEKGPIDHVTNDARYSLSEDRLLRTEFKLEPETLSLNVEYEGKKYKCRVLDCDTITQAKEKMLDTIFRNFSYSQRPPALELDLELTSSGRMLMDEDNSSAKVDGWKQLNTLKHYRVSDGSELVLTQHQKCRTLPRSPNEAAFLAVGSVHSAGFTMREGVPITRTDSEVGTKIWHLVKQHDDSNNMTGGLKMSSEIYLTRLLSTKGTLKQYIDDFFETILTVDSSLPPVIKYLFDMMDNAAHKYSIGDPDVVHTWKCNSLLLRFWVNIIKNPNFVYDIHKPSIVDSCLSVVAQTFMDSCSTSEHRLGKDSPSNKLLFAKDIPKYRKWVEKYFCDIQLLPAVSDQDLNAYLAEVSRMSTGHFTKENALYELYNYVQKYNNEINESLELDGCANAQQLPAKLGHVITAMEGPSVHHLDYV